MRWRSKWSRRRDSRARNSRLRLLCMMIANMLVKLDVAEVFRRATSACKSFQAFFFDASFFDFLINLLLNQTSLFCSKIFIVLLLFLDQLSLLCLLWREGLLHWLQNSLNALLNCLISISESSLLCMSIASSFDLQISFATERVILMNLIDALRDFEDSDIDHEIACETVA